MKASHLLLLAVLLGCTLSESIPLSPLGHNSENNFGWNPFGSNNPFNFQIKSNGESQDRNQDGHLNQQQNQQLNQQLNQQQNQQAKPVPQVQCSPKSKVNFPINDVKLKVKSLF